jgi:hypothetical protein
VYVAGPYRGINSWEVEQNIRSAENYGMQIAKVGAVPVVPHTMYRFWNGTQTDQFWLNATLEILKRCDAIFMCPNWIDSNGSQSEHNFAKNNEIPIFYAKDSGIQKIQDWLDHEFDS